MKPTAEQLRARLEARRVSKVAVAPPAPAERVTEGPQDRVTAKPRAALLLLERWDPADVLGTYRPGRPYSTAAYATLLEDMVAHAREHYEPVGFEWAVIGYGENLDVPRVEACSAGAAGYMVGSAPPPEPVRGARRAA